MPTHQRARKSRENDEIAAMMRRMLRAWVRRLGDADEYDLTEFISYLTEFISFAKDVDLELANVVAAWKASGRSWTEIGRALGITRQAAQQCFGPTWSPPSHAPAP